MHRNIYISIIVVLFFMAKNKLYGGKISNSWLEPNRVNTNKREKYAKYNPLTEERPLDQIINEGEIDGIFYRSTNFIKKNKYSI